MQGPGRDREGVAGLALGGGRGGVATNRAERIGVASRHRVETSTRIVDATPQDVAIIDCPQGIVLIAQGGVKDAER
jgi:hypothetical protein